MKIVVMVAMAAITVTGAASARNIQLPAESGIPVCVDTTAKSSSALFQAEGLASQMFVVAGVTIDWRRGAVCPVDAIHIRVSEDTPLADHPNAYAYALPYQGTHIVLFWDRIASAARPEILPWLLAHVLVHEVTHILQGTCRHSQTGVMKATFTREDIADMRFQPLTFTEEDLALIRSGMTARRARATE